MRRLSDLTVNCSKRSFELHGLGGSAGSDYPQETGLNRVWEITPIPP